MAKKILVFWRDIPSQVIVQRGRARDKRLLSERFQKAIDRAAMRAGKGSSDLYIAEWRRVTEAIETPPDVDAWLGDEVARLEAQFSDERLEAMVRNKGEAEG